MRRWRRRRPGRRSVRGPSLRRRCAGVAPRRRRSWPAIGLVAERPALGLDDAELLTGRRQHHPPGLDLLDALGAERLEARHLGLDVVGLDVEVDPALVVDALHHEQRLGRRGLERAVAVALAGLDLEDLAPEGAAPEVGGRLHVIGAAIDDEGAEL